MRSIAHEYGALFAFSFVHFSHMLPCVSFPLSLLKAFKNFFALKKIRHCVPLMADYTKFTSTIKL